MKFDLRLFLVIISLYCSIVFADEFLRTSIFNPDGSLRKIRQKIGTKYRNLKTKLNNDDDRYQAAPVTATITTTTMINRTETGAETMIDSTSSLAEDYCRDFGPSSSVLLFAYRGSCYSLTNQAVTWSQADQLCQNHFQTNVNRISSTKSQGGLALLDDQSEFHYIRQMIGGFNRSATEFGAYIGFSYQNQSWLWLNGRRVNFIETPPSVIAANNLIFPYQQQKPCGKVELLRPNESTILFGLMQQECTKTERALCKIKIDHCFENNQCGIHGVCHNDGTSFHCECTFLYDGTFCDQYSSEAIQVIAASLFVLVACFIIFICKRSQTYQNHRRKTQYQRRNDHRDHQFSRSNPSKSFFQHISEKFTGHHGSSECQKSSMSSPAPPLPNPRPAPMVKPSKRHRPKPIMDGLLTFIQSFLTVTVAGISIVYICVQRTSTIYREQPEKINKNLSQIKTTLCQWIGNSNSNQNIIMLPLSMILTISLILIHQTLNQSDRKKSFWKKFSFPVIVNPFQKSNRFHTIVVFAIISNQLISLLYEILFSNSINLKHGILFDLVRRLGLIILYGTRYFPILLALNVHSFLSTFLTSLFLSFDLLLSVYFEANCVQTLTSIIPLTARTQIEIARIHYLLIKCLPHYVALGHIIGRFLTLTLRNFLLICKGKSDRWNSMNPSMYHTTSIEYDNDWYYTKNLLINRCRTSSTGYYLYSHSIEEEKHCSCLQKIIHSIYKPKAYFRYSLLVLFTYTVSFLVLYYLTCMMIFSSTFTLRILMNVTGQIIIKLMNLTNINLSIKSLENVSIQREIYLASFLSCFIYIIQLLLGLKKYQNDMLNYYRGNYPKRKGDCLSASNILQRSFHYSGYQVGYLAYGFVIINYFMFIICLFFKLLFIHPLLVKILLKFIAPILILFALKHVIVYCLTKYFFCRLVKSRRRSKFDVQTEKKLDQHDIYAERPDQAIYCESSGSSISTSDDDFQDETHLFTLENRHAYFLFVYFNFFFDCFLGILSCIIRLVKSMIALVLFMPRLDYSTFGRNLEQFDNGYNSYTSYIYVEAMHTHPILLTFTQIIFMNILDKRRRQKHFHSIDEKNILEQNRRRAVRYRWFLLITLMNNPSLIVTRRSHRRSILSTSKDHQRTSSISSLSNRTMTIECASEEFN